MLKRKGKNKERSLDGARFSVCGERAIDWRLCMKEAGSGGGCGEVEGCVLPLCLFRSSTPLPFSLSPQPVSGSLPSPPADFLPRWQ